MYTSSFSFNNDNSDFINFETIFGVLSVLA